MRFASSLVVASASLIVATGVMSRPSQAGPLIGHKSSRIELAQNRSGGPNLFSLFQQIQALQEQVRDLQGQVDTLKYRLKQSKQGQNKLYQRLNKRISELEQNRQAERRRITRSHGSNRGNHPVQNSSVPDKGNDQQNAESDVRNAYMAGFDKLKDGNYQAAIKALKQFVSKYPDTRLTDNAWYWLGEAYYVEQSNDESMNAFQKVVKHFKNSPKVPGSLYKIALIQKQRGDNDSAESTLHRIVKQYPDSDAATLAKKKLGGQ